MSCNNFPIIFTPFSILSNLARSIPAPSLPPSTLFPLFTSALLLSSSVHPVIFGPSLSAFSINNFSNCFPLKSSVFAQFLNHLFISFYPCSHLTGQTATNFLTEHHLPLIQTPSLYNLFASPSPLIIATTVDDFQSIPFLCSLSPASTNYGNPSHVTIPISRSPANAPSTPTSHSTPPILIPTIGPLSLFPSGSNGIPSTSTFLLFPPSTTLATKSPNTSSPSSPS